DLNGFSDTIGALTVNGVTASVTIGTGTLTTNGTVTMTGGSIASTGAGKLVLVDSFVLANAASTSASISGNLDLGAGTRIFNVAAGTADPDLDLTAVVTNGGLSKGGLGTLRLSGTGNNTYTGLTTVSAGILELAKTGGSAFAMAGNLTIDGGVARAFADNELSTATTVTVNAAGTFDLNSFDDFMGPLTVVGGSATIGTGVLTTSLVTMTGGSIASTGAGFLSLEGSVTTNAASTTATISGFIDLELA